MEKNLNVFVFDVDGVMTTGHFLYSASGKVYKIFGPDDNDAIQILSNFMNIQFVTGDKRGFPISKARIVEDMKMPLELVSGMARIEWIEKHWHPKEVVYMGDGIFDGLVFEKVAYSIAPNNADEYVKLKANYVTKQSGGNRAAAEACFHILKKFFGYNHRDDILFKSKKEIFSC